MPLPSAIKLFIDPRTGSAFGNFSGTSSLTNPVFTLGDTATIELYLVEDTGLSAYPRQEIGFPTSPGIKVAVGAIDESPLAGTWSLSYGGNTTTALAFNATPAAVQAALNLLASITAAGGVTVSQIGDNYNIVFNANGARTELITNGAALIPLSSATVATLQTGDANKPAIYLVHLQRTVAGLATSFTPTEPSAINVEALTAWDGTKATYRASISPDPKGGSFSLYFDPLAGTAVSTAAISVGASALDVQNALSVGSLAEGKVSVTQVGAYAYDISVKTQPGTNGLTADAAGLLSYSGYKGEISLNTAEAISLLDGANSVETILEVEITSDSKKLTVLQIPCILHNAVIDEGAVQPLVLDTYLSQTTADGRYFKLSQNLADGTAATMRGNLDVYSTGEVDTALALKASDSDLLQKLSLQGGAMDLNAVVTLSNSTIDSELGGWGFGVELTADPSKQASLSYDYIEVKDGSNGVRLTPAGVTFPDSTVQITAATLFDPAGYATESWVFSQGFTTEVWVQSQGYLTSVPPPSLANLTSDIYWDSYSNTGRLLIAGGNSGDGMFFSARLNFESFTPNQPSDGDFWRAGNKFQYSMGGVQTIASESYVTTAVNSLGNDVNLYYAQKSGTTFTGKLNAAASTAGSAGFNLGAGVAPSSPLPGDVWTAANTDTLRYRAPLNNLTFDIATRNATNTFSSPNIIDTTATTAALRVTQKGTGNAIEVEDSTTPDSTRFVVDQFGKVGIGVAPDATACVKVDANGIMFNASGTQTVAFIDAPNDGNYYVRRNGAWYLCTLYTAGGKTYLTI